MRIISCRFPQEKPIVLQCNQLEEVTNGFVDSGADLARARGSSGARKKDTDGPRAAAAWIGETIIGMRARASARRQPIPLMPHSPFSMPAASLVQPDMTMVAVSIHQTDGSEEPTTKLDRQKGCPSPVASNRQMHQSTSLIIALALSLSSGVTLSAISFEVSLFN